MGRYESAKTTERYNLVSNRERYREIKSPRDKLFDKESAGGGIENGKEENQGGR